MNDDQMLTQEEIDSLLNEGNQADAGGVGRYLTGIEADALGEIGNISFGSAATTLSELLKQKVEITTPEISLIKRSRLKDEFPYPYVAVQVEYTEGLEGSNVLVIHTDDARIIADLMMDGDGSQPPEDIGEMELSAVQEAMNQMMGTASTSMSTVFNKKVDISPPSIEVMDVKDGKGTELIPGDEELMKVSFNLKVGSLIDSNIMQLISVDFAKKLVGELINTGKEEKGEGGEQEKTEAQKAPQQRDQEVVPRMANESDETRHLGSSSRSRDIQSAVFSDFDETNDVQTKTKNLNMLFDIPLQVTVELGRTRRTVKDVLRLSPGSVIELDKLAGEPVDIYVNNKMIAKGEVVVIDENFGVRVTEISSQQDRMQKLQ
ncbi:MAG TPA: flagellar motor switch phosphatase FliY [Bacillales bacterium]|nr:flagellar motor switch phosphatase FliY [Bacillales bacterium]